MNEPNEVLDPESVQLTKIAPEFPSSQTRRMSIDEVREQLAFVRELMGREMKEGQDYGKVPGCGDKPGLFQPGAQKLLMTFRLTDHVKKEDRIELPHPTIFGHREYAFTLCLRSANGNEWDGVGTCSTLEAKYRYRGGSRKCPECKKEAIFKSKKAGEGYYCWAKKGGCGAKFPIGAPEIEGQSVEKAENDNPADFWNTVRKMAFKRALVHAAINATNTSELWSQDLEDLNGRDEYIPKDNASDEFDTGPSREAQRQPPPIKTRPSPVSAPPEAISKPSETPDQRRMKVLHFLKAAPGEPNRDLVRGWLRFRKWITLTDEPEAWQIEHVPMTTGAARALLMEIAEYEATTRKEYEATTRREVA